ncbi:hypothetical protein F4780DRAFT_384165 [Xylariomycetidae sp. FL0641]|nr:hypothetical protein F4780DRAFT_384165 [Xylariomycetidae sp. FL0641]
MTGPRFRCQDSGEEQKEGGGGEKQAAACALFSRARLRASYRLLQYRSKSPSVAWFGLGLVWASPLRHAAVLVRLSSSLATGVLSAVTLDPEKLERRALLYSTVAGLPSSSRSSSQSYEISRGVLLLVDDSDSRIRAFSSSSCILPATPP